MGVFNSSAKSHTGINVLEKNKKIPARTLAGFFITQNSIYPPPNEGRWSKFRRFNTVWESYRAHSLKLAYEPQYAHLKGLDWRSYAYGLEGIYSQDEMYAEKLIKIIEGL